MTRAAAALRAAWPEIRARLEVGEPELVAGVDQLLEAVAGRAQSARDRSRERSERMARAVDEESGALPPRLSLNACALIVRRRIRDRIEQARLSRRPWPYGGLRVAPGLRFIRDRLSRNRAASVPRMHVLHIIVGHFNSLLGR